MTQGHEARTILAAATIAVEESQCKVGSRTFFTTGSTQGFALLSRYAPILPSISIFSAHILKTYTNAEIDFLFGWIRSVCGHKAEEGI